MKILKTLALALLYLPAFTAYGESEDSIWSSEIEVGAVNRSGNTEETNVKLRGEAVRTGELYKTTYQIDFANSSQDDVRTAERLYGVFQLDRSLSDISSIFGRLAYEDDRFSGYDYQVDVTGGYSRDFIKSEIHLLSGSLGVGYRQSELETGDSEDEVIISLAADYEWKFSENATFKQALRTQIGDFQTVSRSDTTLTADVLDDLALKLGLYIRHTSEVPAGRDKTDTETAVTMLYKF
jgi:putative salt-induced outer membrane protein